MATGTASAPATATAAAGAWAYHGPSRDALGRLAAAVDLKGGTP
jgi:hypothetical protein